MRDQCYFCSETECLQEHHVVPRRMNGSDSSENLLTLCPTCHQKIEKIYGDRFYRGVTEFFDAKEKFEDFNDRATGPGRPQDHSSEEVEDMVEDYKSGMSWQDLTQKYDTTQPTLWKRLKERNVFRDKNQQRLS